MSEPYETVAVLGAGAWGTALAQVAATAGRRVMIWAREPEVVEAINGAHENTLFLPGLPLDARVRATGSLEAAAQAGLILAVPPAQHMRSVLRTLSAHLRPRAPIVLCAKGVERGSLALMTDVLAAEIPADHP